MTNLGGNNIEKDFFFFNLVKLKIHNVNISQ
jgi:hypothetical protein